MGEWVREVLLEIGPGAKPPAASPTEQALLAELLALRTIVLNLVYDLASGEWLTAERPFRVPCAAIRAHLSHVAPERGDWALTYLAAVPPQPTRPFLNELLGGNWGYPSG